MGPYFTGWSLLLLLVVHTVCDAQSSPDEGNQFDLEAYKARLLAELKAKRAGQGQGDQPSEQG